MEVFDNNMFDEKTYHELRENVIQYDQKCMQNKMQRQQQAHDYNLQYASLSTKKQSFFRYLKQYGQRHRKRFYRSSGNHSKFYFDINGRPKYPSNRK
jgi:hypothetical protein